MIFQWLLFLFGNICEVRGTQSFKCNDFFMNTKLNNIKFGSNLNIIFCLFFPFGGNTKIPEEEEIFVIMLLGPSRSNDCMAIDENALKK